MADKYVAYVGSYTHGKAKGIKICDCDIEKGRLTPVKEVEVGNPSYMRLANHSDFLYSVSDLGISSFKIHPDGDLEFINLGSINGMRACHISLSADDKYIFTAGYHDGKASVVRINPDGSVGEMTAEVFHKGMGSIAERNYRPHITCARITPDGKFLTASDVGLDQVKLYGFDAKTGAIKLVDILRCELESSPRSMIFSPDGRFAYLICQLKNCVNVYTYNSDDGMPHFEMIQQISTLGKSYNDKSAVAAIKQSVDGKYIFCSNAGDNSIAFFVRDEKTGMLTKNCVLPISGDYPKNMCIFPDNKHIASLNHESNEITFFTIDYENGLLIQHGKPMQVETPNCAVIKKLS